MIPNVIQTFYLDPSAINYHQEAYVCSVDVYFRTKPSTVKNTSGSTGPGVNMYICEVLNNIPDPDRRVSEIVRKPYNLIYAFSDASAATTFGFNVPPDLPAGRFYGICLVFEDNQYAVWTNKQEEFLLNTNQKSSGSTNMINGRFYEAAEDKTTLKHLSDSSMTFKLRVAKFSSNTASTVLVNNDYEFLSLANTSGYFIGGETVWPVFANSAGTISVSNTTSKVVGTGTSFTALNEDSYFVVKSGATEVPMLIDYVEDDTTMYVSGTIPVTNTAAKFYPTCVGKVFQYNPLDSVLYLQGSTANASHKFSTSTYIKGQVSNATSNVSSVGYLVVDKIEPDIDYQTNQKASVKVYAATAVSNGSAWLSSNSAYVQLKNKTIADMANTSAILSKSSELSEGALLNGSSLNIKVDISVANTDSYIFSFPHLDINTSDVYVYSNHIANTTANSTVDTEVYNNGTALNRYISTKVSFANNRFSEDVVCYLEAYRPKGTDIQVYAKVLNSSRDSDAFEDKLWTPLTCQENANRYSGGKDELIEYKYGLPLYPTSNNTLAGSFAVTSGNNVIVASGYTPNTVTWATGQLLKVYDPIFPENYSVHSILSSNTTAFVTDDNASFTGSGMKIDVLKYNRTAFNNKNNSYIGRYYTEDGAIVDKFDTMQIKVVMVSANTTVTPEVESIQVIGTSA